MRAGLKKMELVDRQAGYFKRAHARKSF
jgi:hypothetical protein